MFATRAPGIATVLGARTLVGSDLMPAQGHVQGGKQAFGTARNTTCRNTSLINSSTVGLEKEIIDFAVELL